MDACGCEFENDTYGLNLGPNFKWAYSMDLDLCPKQNKGKLVGQGKLLGHAPSVQNITTDIIVIEYSLGICLGQLHRHESLPIIVELQLVMVIFHIIPPCF